MTHSIMKSFAVMKFTLSWLQRHLNTDKSPSEISQTLSAIGLEVENIIDNTVLYQPFIIGEILEVTPHPNADKLKICQVYNGIETLQIVCGAANARVGIAVVLAPIGAVIPHNGLHIKKSSIRGIESYGMLCSAEELNLNYHTPINGIIEIIDFDPKIIGTNFAKWIGLYDTIFDIAITPNRGDCASVLGIARDLHAAYIGELMPIEEEGCQNLQASIPSINATITSVDACQEYAFFTGHNIRNQRLNNFLPFLTATGYTSKSAVVDISNFIMFDIGRPNHIYDADTINGNITVRYSQAGEKFTAIGNIQYILPAGILVVADQEKIISIAGVIGSEATKVTLDTTNIFVEVANFKAESIMHSGRTLNIITDARFRFERHIDHANTELTIAYLQKMIQNSCGGVFSTSTIRHGQNFTPCHVIVFNDDCTKKIAGISIMEGDEILQRLGFEKKMQNITVPSWRVWDVQNATDIVEEILRIYGLAKIPQQYFIPLQLQNQKNLSTFEDKAIDRLVQRNMHEVMSWSFTESKIADHFIHTPDELITLKNPINSEMSLMRPSIICTLLPLIEKNATRGIVNLALFELGTIYSTSFEQQQRHTLTGIRTGYFVEQNVHDHARCIDFFDIKADVLSVLEEFPIPLEEYHLSREVASYYHPMRSASLKINNTVVAMFGELHPKITTTKKIDSVFCFEIFLQEISSRCDIKKRPFIISDYQVVKRDFAFIVPKDMLANDIIISIQALQINILQSISIFDVYEGEGVKQGYKSVAITTKFCPKDKTLTEQEIDSFAQQIISQVCKDHPAELRADDSLLV